MSYDQKTSLDSLILPMPTRRCKYGGDDEYYVTVLETGSHKQEHDHTEQSVERTQARV